MAYLDNFTSAWELSPPKRNPDDLGFDDLEDDVEEEEDDDEDEEEEDEEEEDEDLDEEDDDEDDDEDDLEDDEDDEDSKTKRTLRTRISKKKKISTRKQKKSSFWLRPAVRGCYETTWTNRSLAVAARNRF